MGDAIGAGADRFTQQPAGIPRRVSDPTARAPIGATVEDLVAAVPSAVKIAGVPEHAAAMRRHLRIIAGPHRREFPIIESLASELFNNACLHTRSGDIGGEVTVIVIKMPGRIQVKVIDQGPRPGEEKRPQMRPAELDETGLLPEGGFGLRLVDQEATRWGVVREPGRTTVWFDLCFRRSARTRTCN